MSGFDALIALVFIAWCITAGFRARTRASRNLDEYFLAGRDIKGWKAGISMASTQFAADTPLLFCGLIATAGVFALWRLWIYGLAFLLMGFLFAALWRRAGILTDAELVEVRYSGRWRFPLRITKAVYFGLVINSAVLGFVLFASLQVSEMFLPWHVWLPDGLYRVALDSIVRTNLELATGAAPFAVEIATTNNVISLVLLASFVALYSTTGGLRGVISSDIFQFVIAMAGSLVFAVILLGETGGISGLTERITFLYGQARAESILSLAPTVEGAMMPFLVIVGMQWLFQMNSDGTGYLAQRSMACSTDREARIAAVVFAWVQILGRTLIWMVIGLALLVLYPFSAADLAEPAFAAERERTFLAGISDFLPNGARGLMITALLAALASTLDTHINWGSSYLTNDIYKSLVCRLWLKRNADSRELVLVARITSILVLLGGCVVAANLDSIQQGWKISLLFGAGIGAVLILRWVWERINSQSEFAAMAAALFGGPILLWLFPGDDMDWIRLACMACLSTCATVLTALFTLATDPDVLQTFYRQVRPVGFWGGTAARSDDDPARCRRALGRILVSATSCGASLFLILAGSTKLLLRLPGESFVMPLALMLAGALLVPVWWRRMLATGEAEA